MPRLQWQNRQRPGGREVYEFQLRRQPVGKTGRARRRLPLWRNDEPPGRGLVGSAVLCVHSVRRNEKGLKMKILSSAILAAMLATAPVLLTGCAPKPVAATQGEDGVQSVKITVHNGYSPQVVNAKANMPLRIEFYRNEKPGAESCDDTVVIPAEKIKLFLPAYQSQIVEIRSQPPGEMPFHCGMDMMHGKIVFK